MKFFDMKQTFLVIMAVLLFVSVPVSAQNPPEEPPVEELASKEADRIAGLLNLEPWQVFYVDSTLQHDIAALKAEMEALNKNRVMNTDVYMKVQDRWLQQVDDTYKKIFTKEQWDLYWKISGARAQKARDKRAEKANEKPSEKGGRKSKERK